MPAEPLQAPLCPLCGQPNACAAAATGSFDAPCWCQSVRFTEELLGRIPLELRNQACVCRRCAEGSAQGRRTEPAGQG